MGRSALRNSGDIVIWFRAKRFGLSVVFSGTAGDVAGSSAPMASVGSSAGLRQRQGEREARAFANDACA
jgi:hypothetical protein